MCESDDSVVRFNLFGDSWIPYLGRFYYFDATVSNGCIILTVGFSLVPNEPVSIKVLDKPFLTSVINPFLKYRFALVLSKFSSQHRGSVASFRYPSSTRMAEAISSLPCCHFYQHFSSSEPASSYFSMIR